MVRPMTFLVLILGLSVPLSPPVLGFPLSRAWVLGGFPPSPLIRMPQRCGVSFCQPFPSVPIRGAERLRCAGTHMDSARGGGHPRRDRKVLPASDEDLAKLNELLITMSSTKEEDIPSFLSANVDFLLSRDLSTLAKAAKSACSTPLEATSLDLQVGAKPT